MEPGIRPGDGVDVVPLPAGGPLLGDVVLFEDAALGHVVHRVIWRWPLRGAPRVVYTKGDAVPHRDRRVEAGQVRGLVARVLRAGSPARPGRRGRRALWLRSLVGMTGHRLGLGRAAGSSLPPAMASVTTEIGSPGNAGGVR